MQQSDSRGIPDPDRRWGANPPSGQAGEPGEEGLTAPPGFDHLEGILGYGFRNRRLLEEALTHGSLINEIPDGNRCDNERLEFLGDAVLGLIMTEWLMETFPWEAEGELTRLRSSLVKEKRLAEAARTLQLGEYLHLGKGEERMGGRRKRSILADAFEAVVGAIYLDGGLEAVRDFIRRVFVSVREEAGPDQRPVSDAKTRLQELMLALFRRPPVYEVADACGPDHAKTFVIHLRLHERTLAFGKGTSKKEAEQDAAENFLLDLEKNPLGLL
jgi:ribonuclease-3